MISLVIFCNSCKTNSQSKGYETFEKELSNQVIEKMAKNSPYPLSDKVVADYKFYPYYKTFGNSGVCIQFNIPKNDEKTFNAKLNSYKHLNSNSILYKDSSYVYVYNEPNTNIEIPELTDELGDLSTVKLNNDMEIDAYVIENGELTNVFIEGNKKIYNYSIGIYKFKKSSTCIYWLLLY